MRYASFAALFAIFAALFPAQSAAAAETPTPTAQRHALPISLPATFQGVTPCADCPGIRVTVTLKADGTYALKRVYLERKGTFEEHGTWSYDQGRERLTLLPSGKGSPELFSVSFSAKLQMLDTAGKPLPSQMNSTLSEVAKSFQREVVIEETTTNVVVGTLASTGWTLAELGGKPFTSSEEHPVTMQFDAEGKRVSGSGGCNRYSGGYEQDGDQLTFEPLVATKMMCQNIGQEDAFFAMLTGVATFKRDGDWLTLYGKDGTALAKFGFAK